MPSITELKANRDRLIAKIAEAEHVQREINDIYEKIERARKSTLISVWSALADQLRQKKAHLETLLE